jgi:hypothetical protein
MDVRRGCFIIQLQILSLALLFQILEQGFDRKDAVAALPVHQ